jgi:zinc/manganese transport system substrate-binding protein
LVISMNKEHLTSTASDPEGLSSRARRLSRRPFALALALGALGCLSSASLLSADDEVRVVCTIPDLADAARRIGGEHVVVHSLAKGTENVHAVRIRPSDLNRTARADLFIEMGLSLEHAFVPGLLENARNKAIQPGAPGFVNCSDGWQPIDVPESVSRSDAADLHPMGNPHFNLDPRGGRHIAERVLQGLIVVAPEREEVFRANHARYLKELDEKEASWADLGKKLKGTRVVTYHGDFDYLLRSLGIERSATIEPKPGVTPTPRYLASIVAKMKKDGISVIVTSAWSNNRSVRFVAEKTGARIVVLPGMVGASKQATTWVALMDDIHRSLVDALSPPDKD